MLGTLVPSSTSFSPSVVTCSYQALSASFLPPSPSPPFLHLSLGFEAWIQFAVLTVGFHRASLIAVRALVALVAHTRFVSSERRVCEQMAEEQSSA